MTRTPPASLPAIIALARSGALGRARRLFDELDLGLATNDPATLGVHGRLLKDEARRAAPADRAPLWRRAGDAYARAAELSGATYHLINAATLAQLAGDRATAENRARQVLDKLDAGDTGSETPYYLGATRAEALLLLGRTDEAQAALNAACRLAPEAWEDHASTLQQFNLILEAFGQDASWLGPLRPPRSLHFAGPLAVVDDETICRRIDKSLAEDRIGFAYGALAGGADIIISEAVLAMGAELHLVLPAPPAVFRADSAEPLGGDWPDRFDAVLAKAASVSVVAARITTTTMLHIQLAAEVAMGKAVMKAASLASEAVQLLLIHPDGPIGATTLIGEQWRRSNRRQTRLEMPRSTRAPAWLKPLPVGPDDGVLTAMLAIAVKDEDEDTGGADFPGPGTLDRIGRALTAAPAAQTVPTFAGQVLHLAFANPAEAAEAASVIIGASGLNVGGVAAHYGVARLIDSPFGGPPGLIGSAAAVAPDMLASTPAGAVHVSEPFAAALHCWTSVANGETPYIGDLLMAGEAMPLHALTRFGA